MFESTNETHVMLVGLEKGSVYQARVAGVNEIQPGGILQTGVYSAFIEASTLVDRKQCSMFEAVLDI